MSVPSALEKMRGYSDWGPDSSSLSATDKECVTLSKTLDLFPSHLKMGPIAPTLPHLIWLLWKFNEIMFVNMLWELQKQHTLIEFNEGCYLLFITRGECGSLLL